MARRKSSPAEDVVDITSHFPWWVGVGLAIVAFVAFRVAAGIEVPPVADAKQIGGMMARQLIKAGANLAQWLVPVLLLIGAVVSVLKQRKRASLHSEVAAKATSALNQLSWQDFERMVGEYFRQREFSVAETGGGGADGGVDLVLKRGSDRYFVQCKHWKALRVGVEPVRELYGVMAAQRAAGGFVVTSGTFTEEARRFVDGREIQLIDGERLTAAVRKQASLKSVGPAMSGSDTRKVRNEATCPKCGAEMVLRKAKTGSLAGQSFWGCTRFPACRGTRAA